VNRITKGAQEAGRGIVPRWVQQKDKSGGVWWAEASKLLAGTYHIQKVRKRSTRVGGDGQGNRPFQDRQGKKRAFPRFSEGKGGSREDRGFKLS